MLHNKSTKRVIPNRGVGSSFRSLTIACKETCLRHRQGVVDEGVLLNRELQEKKTLEKGGMGHSQTLSMVYSCKKCQWYA